ncbi:MAG: lamin tail domain-containing protein, partial [Phycisphaerae bacterium]|nr:lamin tail domain-containing protein [Saprospiraceae bacterium]
MKKIILALSLLLCILATGHAQVVITEIMYNPPESGNDSLEYIELNNFNNLPTDISGWTFTPINSIEYVFPAGTIMPPGGYIVVAKSASAFQSVFGFTPLVWTAGALSNNGELIELRDAAGTLRDNVTYSNALPWPAEAAGLGPSIVLCDFNSDNSLPGNWQAATTGTGIIINGNEVKGNPGAASGCMGSNQITAVDDNAAVPTGQATFINVQGNDLIIDALTLFIITLPPTHGTATVSGHGIIYQSNAGYCGPDQFNYQICDAANCSEATVNINVKCYPQRTIGLVTSENPNTGVADSLNANCELQGTVYGVNLRPLNNNVPSLLFTIIDNNGDGIAVSTLGGTFGYTVKEKDKVTVRGTIAQFNGQTEIRPDTIIKISENNPLLAPILVTSLSEATESKLIEITSLHLVDAAEWTTGVGASGFNVRAVSDNHPNDTILIRIDHDVENYNAPAPTVLFDLTGIGGQFDATNPFTSGYQVLPRYNDDIDLIAATNEADFSSEVLLSPNPASNMISIEMSTSFDRVTLLNAKGQEIKTYYKPDNQQKVDVSLYKSGVYFARFEKAGKSWTTRFVK